MPLGLSVSKISFVGKQPLNFTLQYYRNVVRPDDAGANQIRMQVSFLPETCIIILPALHVKLIIAFLPFI